MKKHLIAAAVAAAVAVPAMAQVTVSGNLDIGFADSKFEASGSGSSIAADLSRTGNTSAMSTSTIAVSGTEDLGGGLKASFFYNQQLNNYTGTEGSRDNWLSLSGGFGEVKIGRFTPAAETAASAVGVTVTTNTPGSIDPFFGGATYGGTPAPAAFDEIARSATSSLDTSGANLIGITDIGRKGGNIQYTTPTVNGFKGVIGYARSDMELSATGSATLTSSVKQTDFALTYSAGPLLLGVTHAKGSTETISNAAVATDTKFTAAGATYDFGVAKLNAAYLQRDDDLGSVKAIDASGWTVGVKVPVGQLELMGSVMNASDDADATETDISGYQLAGVYNLSKRTNLYAVYGSEKYEFNGAGSPEAKVNSFAVGVRHSF